MKRKGAAVVAWLWNRIGDIGTARDLAMGAGVVGVTILAVLKPLPIVSVVLVALAAAMFSVVVVPLGMRKYEAFQKQRRSSLCPLMIAPGIVREIREVTDLEGEKIEGFWELRLFIEVLHKGNTTDTIRNVSARLSTVNMVRKMPVRNEGAYSASLRHGEALLFEIGTTIQPQNGHFLPSYHFHGKGKAATDRKNLELTHSHETHPTRSLNVVSEEGEFPNGLAHIRDLAGFNLCIVVSADDVAATERWYTTNLFAEDAGELLLERGRPKDGYWPDH